MTTASTGLPIPVVDASAARSAALRLRQAATAADRCLDELAAASRPEWSGVASQAHLDGRAVVSRRATDLAEACRLLDRAVVAFSEEMAVVLPRWRAAAERRDALELTLSDPLSAGLAAVTPDRLESLGADRDDATVEALAWERRYGDATAALSAACSQVMAVVDDGVLSTADQLWAIPGTVVDQLVVQPVALAALLVDDPSRAAEVGSAAWSGLVDQVRHPRRTAEEAAGVPAYEEGRWGEGVGTGVVSVVGALGLRRLIAGVEVGHTTGPDGSPVWPPAQGTKGIGRNGWLTPEQLVAFRRNIDTRDADAPVRPQTFDEMRADLDLTRSEHPTFGHTISRHVEASEEYLEFRLRWGTPENDGSISRPPPTASRWNDLATAQETIQRMVRDADADQLRALTGPGDATVTLTRSEPGIGDVRRLGHPGEDGLRPVVAEEAGYVEAVIVKEGDDVYVLTTRLYAADPRPVNP